MRTITMLSLIAGAAFQAQAQSPNAQDSLRARLQDPYALTKLSDDHSQVITAGAVLTLKQDGLVLVASGSPDIEGNTYKDRKIKTNAAGKANQISKTVGNIWKKIPGVPQAPDSIPTNVDSRKFVAGEKLNVTRITVKPDNSVAMELYSLQPYNDVYYWATLTFAADKDTSSNDKMVRTAADVFSVGPADTPNTDAAQSGGAGKTIAPAAPRTTVPVERYANIPAPVAPVSAAPAPAPTHRLTAGMTISQVRDGFGEPTIFSTWAERSFTNTRS